MIHVKHPYIPWLAHTRDEKVFHVKRVRYSIDLIDVAKYRNGASR